MQPTELFNIPQKAVIAFIFQFSENLSEGKEWINTPQTSKIETKRNLSLQSGVLESRNCYLIASYYRHLRLVVLESFSHFQTHLSHAGKKPVLTCHLAILKNTTQWCLSGLFPPFFY